MRDRVLVGVVLLATMRACMAQAGEAAAPAAVLPGSEFNFAPRLAATALLLPPVSMAPLPMSYQAVDLSLSQPLSATEFRPRGRSLLDKDPRFGAAEEAPMLRGTTAWQRLSDYRSRDRVRVVTLWETGGSSVSLQAGRKGDPSLQWTSRSMNRGGATRGLLDQMVSTSLGGFARSLHLMPRTAGAEPLGKSSKPMDSLLGNAPGTK